MTTNYSAGHDAEKRAAEYLQSNGFNILEVNWRTQYCEIDIVAQKRDMIHLVEVKYRSHDKQGMGVDYITPRKLHQMKFAAESWVAHHSWSGHYTLSALSIDGDNFELIEDLL
jgi:putative endonuclease